jgi:hypothetical protein
MICITNEDRLGGDPKVHDKLKKLIGLNRELIQTFRAERKKIISEYGYCGRLDGFDQAMEIAIKTLKSD